MTTAGAGMGIFFLGWTNTFSEMLLTCSLFGVFVGSVYSTAALVYSEALEGQSEKQEKLASALGFACLLRAVLAIAVAITLGMYINWTLN